MPVNGTNDSIVIPTNHINNTIAIALISSDMLLEIIGSVLGLRLRFCRTSMICFTTWITGATTLNSKQYIVSSLQTSAIFTNYLIPVVIVVSVEIYSITWRPRTSVLTPQAISIPSILQDEY